MTSALENVSNVAVWGSLAGSLLLGSYLIVQSITDKTRRARFILLGFVSFCIAGIDFCHGSFDFFLYEKLRIVVWSVFAASLLLLFGHSIRVVVATLFVLPCFGAIVWLLVTPELATTAVVPTAFAIAAYAHFHQYLKSKGYASCVLAGFSGALSLLCYCYYFFISSGDSRSIGLGYVHYALLSALAIFFGWVNLPRELRGRSPVKVEIGQMIVFYLSLALGEVGVLLSLLVIPDAPIYWYLAFSVLQVLGTLILFFNYRHELVIYTDNVSMLLDERTTSLRAAQATLARQNERQKELLREQEVELLAKAQVIERQRRLELAAQTAGQTAHDIQNLLSPIYACLARLEQEQTHGAVSEIGASLRRQADELQELNAQLLALARRGRIERVPINLRDLIAELSQRYRGMAIEISDSNDCWIAGAWSQLSRAITNLVSNAFDAYALERRKGKVVVKSGIRVFENATRCHLGFLQPGRYAFVSVQDRAGGISHEILERIFEPFFSSKSSTLSSGTGLGLTIVAAVVEDHGGVLDLDSNKNGTTFTLYFPEIDSCHQPEVIERGEGTVLLVDDDLAVLAQYELFLKEAGYECISVTNGDEAIRVLQVEDVGVILLDLNMPRRNGYETFFAAMHLRPGIRAVVHSSYCSEPEQVRLRELGVESILQKPASRREVLSAIAQAFKDFHHSQLDIRESAA